MPYKNPTKAQIARRRCRALKRGIVFTVVYEDVGEPPERCPCCDQRMKRGGIEDMSDSPSLDRLVGSQGYIPGNVLWLCVACNRIKQDCGPAELYRVADWLWREYQKRGLSLPSTELYPQQEKADEQDKDT